MAKQVKGIYRILAWFFSVVIAAGTLVGCGGKKYGPPEGAKYGPPAYNTTKSSLNTPIIREKTKYIKESERS
jgi:hypothetical protein